MSVLETFQLFDKQIDDFQPVVRASARCIGPFVKYCLIETCCSCSSCTAVVQLQAGSAYRHGVRQWTAQRLSGIGCCHWQLCMLVVEATLAVCDALGIL